MKYLISFIQIFIFNILGALIAKYQCDCSLFVEESICLGIDTCNWINELCVNKDCFDMDENECDLIGKCSLNQEGNCESSSFCTNYQVKDQIDCMIKKGNCGAENQKNAAGFYQCKSYNSVDCNSLAAENCTNNYEDRETFCWLNSTKQCQSYNINSCEGLPLDVCDKLECKNSNSQCSAFLCSDITSQDQCTYVQDGTWGSLTLCQWKEDQTPKCIERTETKDFTNITCSKMTDGRYYWKNESCVSCPKNYEDNSSSSLSLILYLIYVLQYL
ncbi:unnamed protein product (macronuclear) [Paramecium tetraurelia]|uniref:Mini antigen n=1 Tax=Paramecium tetraurelia TaxID=5888 RepID=A0BPM8_PARTE|nr:uncharacterized protein GSPATT00005244001 [Paramecium tetraurelia]CAK60495.1 unnamed protein product [Paramecium tetraurelia]|eukprot:XP_001427893.1 hypothetical protein (macronuclear) [Paramecium tetraurelia strain d4-2]